MIKVKRTIQFSHSNRGRRQQKPPTGKTVERGHIPRVSRLMALAIRFNQLIQDGTITDQSELSRLAHVTQPRMTQIMNLLHLAPDLQEEILFLPRVVSGRDPIHEKMLRPISAEIDWARQREMWHNAAKR